MSTTAWGVPQSGSGSGGRIAIFALVLLLSVLFGLGVLLTDALAVLGLAIWIAAVIIPIKPRVGLYAALGLCLLFEAGSPDKLMVVGDYLHGGLTGSAGISGAVASPLELLLLLAFLSWTFQSIARGDFGLRGILLLKPVLIFGLVLALGYLRGLLGGGDLYIGLFESRYLFYVPITFILAASTMRSLADIRALIAIVLAATGLFAVEGAYRKLALIDTGALGVIPEYRYQHEDVIFLASTILLIVGLVVFAPRSRLRVIAIVALPFIMFTLLAAERRAGFIALIIGFLAVSTVLLVAHRRAFGLLVVPLMIGSALYFPIFWNDTGMLGQPARAVRSLSEPDRRDASSNVARVLETINVGANIDSDAILGLGFGREYRFVVAVPDLSWWPLWHYVAHNNVLWLWLKLGLLGFVAFWVFLGSAIVRSVQLARTMVPPEAKVLAILALAAVVTTLVFSYVDIALLSGRVTVFLGTTLGALGALERIVRGSKGVTA
jgi:O-antigen ligase